MTDPLIPLHSIGSLISIPARDGTALAFVPHPLPNELELSTRTVNLLSEADRAIGQLYDASYRIPNPDLLMKYYVGQEALFSSRIEGTVTTLFEVFEAQARSTEYEAPTEDENIAEVNSYISALHHGLENLESLSTNPHDFFHDIHRILMNNPRGVNKDPGEYRQVQVSIGIRKHFSDVEHIHIPPPVNEMKKTMNDFGHFINTANDLPPLIAIALAHYQFETIHPFRDGNGRLGRMLIIFQMIALGLLSRPLLPLSIALLVRREQYGDSLQDVHDSGRYDLWLQFFLKSVSRAVGKSLDQIRDLEELKIRYQNRILEDTKRATDIADLLFRYPVITANQFVSELNISRATAGRWINQLQNHGIIRLLHSKHGRGKLRFYVAEGIFEILDPADHLK